MRSSTLLALTGFFALISATPVSPALPRPLSPASPLRARQDNGTNSTLPACAQVSQAIYSIPEAERPLTGKVPAKLAYDCLLSVPLNASSAKKLLKELPVYLNWQSTIKSLADPPAEYVEKVQPPVDILAGLVSISADVDAGKYTNEYDFGWALFTLIQSAHDGHFSYVPDSVGSIFSWGRPVPLVSVSADGSQLPAIFVFADVLGMQFKNISYTPSPVVEIDGTDAKEFLENVSQYGSLQDRDALYNNLFYQLAQVSQGEDGSGTGMFTGGGRGRYVYPGPTTTLKFANGTEYTMENYANVYAFFRGITTGEDLAAKNFFYSNAAAASALGTADDTSAASAESASVTIGQPTPVVAGPGGIINGYYLNTTGNEDVAVLQISSFVGYDSWEAPFQATSQEFFAKAKADGKTKLIIDVQANGGGTILQGYDLFKQLFPSIDPYGANRYRYTEVGDLIGQAYSAYSSQYPRGGNNSYQVVNVQDTWFNYETDMTVDGKPFNSWQEKVGPVEVNGDKYTTVNRWNLSDVLISYAGGINITGYGPLANVTGAPPFKAENIVLLTDGYCASTCTIFSEFLTKQAGVKTIALGGRSNTKKIQAIGGVKGVNNYGFSYITSAASHALNIAPPTLAAKLNNSALVTDFESLTVFSRASNNPGLNVRDGLAYNDTSGVALQFIYEEADCRLYFTPEMTIDATAIWDAAAAAQWGASGKCVGADNGYGLEEARVKDVDVDVTTTGLKAGLVQVSHADALEAFEKSFSLETSCKKEMPGFMQP